MSDTKYDRAAEELLAWAAREQAKAAHLGYPNHHEVPSEWLAILHYQVSMLSQALGHPGGDGRHENSLNPSLLRLALARIVGVAIAWYADTMFDGED